MKRIHIVGRKNSGKTTLIVELVDCLTQLGLRVGTIKHTHHNHELDTPGKDSFRHRKAGAHAVGILSPQMNAVFWPQETAGNSHRDARYDLFESLMLDCDMILVEGDSQTSATKVEVWRAENKTDPICQEDSSIEAMVTEDTLTTTTPIFRRNDLRDVVRWLLSKLQIDSPALRDKKDDVNIANSVS